MTRKQSGITRLTTVPFREWPWHRRALERLYRLTHGGAIRTIVVRTDEAKRAELDDLLGGPDAG
jgi:hypothetical protein